MDVLREQGEQLVGRRPELTALKQFLGSSRPPRTLVLLGGAGIGKTTLWEAGNAAAREQRLRVLAARASEAEAQLAFAGLIDLLDGVDIAELGLPAPQRRALDVALLRAEPTDVPVQSQAIAVGLLNGLRALAAREALVVAIDDLQWLDPPSADALAFATRRLRDEAVAFLLATRPGSASALERTLEEAGLERIEVGPLSLGATRRLLYERLGLALPRHLLRQLVDSTLGNPLFALEVGRVLVQDGLPAIGKELPVPEAVEDAMGTRVTRLPSPVRTVLLAVALNADLTPRQLRTIAHPAAVEDAVEAGVVLIDGDRVRPSHPLLAADARQRSRPSERRELHRRLAGVVADEELRVLHLALGTDTTDARLAETIASAAGGASARGAHQQAVELAEHALRLTPPRSAARSERLLALADQLALAGEAQRVTDLLAPELDSLPRGPLRGRAYLLMTDGVVTSNDDIVRYLERALAESRGDPALEAEVLAELSIDAAVIRVQRIGDAEAWALEALPHARSTGPAAERRTLQALAWARSLRGRAIDDVCERFRAASPDAFNVSASPDRIAGQRLVWRGELDRARALLTALLSEADERGEPSSYALQRLHVCELELRAGRWAAAERLLDEWAESSERVMWPMYERCRALLAAGRGLPPEAEEWAGKALAGAEETGNCWDELEAFRALGTALLLAGEPERAAERLRAVWEHTEREGVADPGVFPVAPDLVEAQVELDDLDAARAVTDRLTALAEEQDHPWAAATARRCRGLVRLASGGHDDEAAADVAGAADAYGELGLPVDRARSLLGLGRAQRRLRKWGAARRSLERAAATFEEIGSTGWAEAARSELARVGARRPRPAGELTPSEQRVVELALAGLSNKEIARTLSVAVNTVEVHLSHAYAKLGVHSRSQLARRLSARA